MFCSADVGMGNDERERKPITELGPSLMSLTIFDTADGRSTRRRDCLDHDEHIFEVQPQVFGMAAGQKITLNTMAKNHGN